MKARDTEHEQQERTKRMIREAKDAGSGLSNRPRAVASV
jgi:hypothetical protein